MRRASTAIAALLAAACGAPPQETSNAVEKKDAPVAARPAPTAVPRPPAAPHVSPWSPSGYALNGAAPVWGGSLTGTTVRYMTPDDQFGDEIATRVAYAAETETYSGEWRRAPFALTLRRVPCTDGLSERIYPFSVELRARGETRRGCADPQ